MPTHTLNRIYQTPAGAITSTITITDDTELNSDLVLAASSTNVLLTLAMTRANLKSLALVCTADCTVKTNSSSSPLDTISLTANTPLLAGSASEAAALLPNTSAVSALYLTCANGGTFSLRSILSQDT
jgi:hypothetical protein